MSLLERQPPNELFKARQKLAQSVADSFSIPGWSKGECRNEALIALQKAAESYDPQEGPFEPFAREVIKNSLINAYKKAKLDCSREVTTLDQAIGDSEETLFSKDTIEDMGPSPALEAERNDIRNALKEGFLQLTPIERSTLELFTSGKNYAEIARERGVSLQAVRQTIESGKSKLRPFLVARGIACARFLPSSARYGEYRPVPVRDFYPEIAPKKPNRGCLVATWCIILLEIAFFGFLFWVTMHQ